MSHPIHVGELAPVFSLPSKPGETVSLGDFRGRPVVLAFYPADWSPVCRDQLKHLEAARDKLGSAQVVGVSVDGPWSHAAFAKERKLHFPLLSDSEPKGAVARLYGVYRDADGVAERALFVIDADGRVAWNKVCAIDADPGTGEVLEALEKLATPRR